MKPIIQVNGDQSFIIKLGDVISPQLHRRVKQYAQQVHKLDLEGITQVICTYTDVCVYYNPLSLAYAKLIDALKSIDLEEDDLKSERVNVLSIPVCYQGAIAPDIEYVANYNQMSTAELVHLHCEAPYLIYMLGFSPGFVYLGGLNPRLETPRKEVPRQAINAGAVGIAGNQTGIYPIVSPGGWQIIGQTPLQMFAPDREPPVLVQSGDYIQFEAISEQEYKLIEQEIEEGNYNPVIQTKELTYE
ncbi:5-oxoprolinase subunit PxpB [Carboxylicivirga sp. M1479]|uniref:5-oxoprolinase subunit PxpB n=1 Tax=Carboxylicivirga sp. M1479 TaxID=2594476 RepID=UPI00163D6A2B|nr:5-oxoprolinase subunit PxpB [Carboxylicivirga sp. M1479]